MMQQRSAPAGGKREGDRKENEGLQSTTSSDTSMQCEKRCRVAVNPAAQIEDGWRTVEDLGGGGGMRRGDFWIDQISLLLS